MRKAIVALVLAGTVLSGTSSLAAAATYGVGDYYNFTRAYIGQVTSGAYGTQPVFVGNPGNSFANLSQSQYFPTITGMTVNIPIPAGNHTSNFFKSFTDLQIGRVYSVLSAAGAITGGGKGGAGVPGPIAGAGLPVLAAAAFALFRRRRSLGSPVASGNLLAA